MYLKKVNILVVNIVSVVYSGDLGFQFRTFPQYLMPNVTRIIIIHFVPSPHTKYISKESRISRRKRLPKSNYPRKYRAPRDANSKSSEGRYFRNFTVHKYNRALSVSVTPLPALGGSTWTTWTMPGCQKPRQVK